MSIQHSLSKLFFIAALLSLASCSRNKTAYVDMFKLVQGFELQKEYTAQVKADVDREKAAVDSVLYTMNTGGDAGTQEAMKNRLYGALYQKTEQRNKEVEDMIWKRLNPYLTDYGKEKGYTYIYGANGTGNVLYADKSQDITDVLIKYVNQRYHDQK